jgi:hypothetical protein
LTGSTADKTADLHRVQFLTDGEAPGSKVQTNGLFLECKFKTIQKEIFYKSTYQEDLF